MWCNGNISDFDSEFVGSNPTVAAKIINGMCQDIDKHNAILDSYANNQNGHR